MQKVLMIYEKFPPYNVSGTARGFYFAKNLPKFGYRPYLLSTVVPSGEEYDAQKLSELEAVCDLDRSRLFTTPFIAKLKELYANTRGRALIEAQAGREGAPKQKKIPGKSKFPRWLWRIYWAIVWRLYWFFDWTVPAMRMAMKAARSNDFKLVWASGPHSRNMVAGYWVAKILRKPLVLDIRDPWTYGSLWVHKTKNVEDCERKWAKKILSYADAVIFTSPLTMKLMRDHFPGCSPEKMFCITNGFSEEFVEPLRGVDGDKFLFRYIGSLNQRRKPDILLAAMKLACQDPEVARDIRLEFVGGMAGHEAKIPEYGLESQVFDVGRVSANKSIRYMHGADVNILLQTITEGVDVVSGKAFEYLAASKPVLAVVDEAGGDAWLMKELKAGEVVPYSEVENVAEAITNYWRLWKSGEVLPVVDKEKLKAFSRYELTSKLVDIFSKVAP